MVNNRVVSSFIKQVLRKEEEAYDYDIYKKDHLVTPKEVVNVYDLGYLGVENDFPEQLSSLPYRKKRNYHELSL
jgi:hypothetical protein